MATFSTNQVRHLYVATSKKSPHVLASDDAGSIAVKNDSTKNHLYFEYKGADTVMRSDLIEIKNILYAKATNAEDMGTDIKSVSVSLDSSVNNGDPIGGQDYILRIMFRQYIGMSDADQYIKYGMVHAYADMTPDKFYKELAQSLAKNFSREVTPLIKVEVHSKATKDKGNFDADGYMVIEPTTKDNGKADNTNAYYTETSIVNDIDSIRITEVEQPWRRGIMAQVPVYFTVQAVEIIADGDERNWALVTEGTNGTISNGKNIADLEYFCMGERGDVYRGMAFPNNITTTYLVNPSQPYHTLDIHYAYSGSNEAVQKSEKDIVIVCSDKAVMNEIITDLNAATGLEVAQLA